MIRCYGPIFLIVAVLACPGILQAQAGSSNNAAGDSVIKRVLRGLDSFVDFKVNAHQFSGVVLLAKLYPLPSAAAPVFLKAYGQADLEKNIWITPDTRFITASTAKSFTAVGILQLAESGKIDPDLPLSHYLPDEEYPHQVADHITIRQLLTHTAGLGDVITGKPFRSAPESFHHFSELVALVRKEGPVSSPGKFLYGNSDYVLLGAVIERVTGLSFADYMSEHVFIPAGMLNTGYDMAVRPQGLAHGYTVRNIGSSPYSWPVRNAAGDTIAVLRPNDAILPKTGVPGTVAYTTASDLMLFARALVHNRLLQQKTLGDLWTGKIETGQEGPNQQYGYGFFTGWNGKYRIVNHGGTGPGIDICFDIYPDLGYVVAIMSNLDPPAAQDIRQYIREGMTR